MCEMTETAVEQRHSFKTRQRYLEPRAGLNDLLGSNRHISTELPAGLHACAALHRSKHTVCEARPPSSFQGKSRKMMHAVLSADLVLGQLCMPMSVCAGLCAH